MIHNKKLLYLSIVLVLAFSATFFISKGMFSAFLLLFILFSLTFFILRKMNKLTKTLQIILCLSFLLHFFLVIGMYYTDFRPVGGGADYEGYQRIAQQTSERFLQGNFSLDGAHYGHDFPIVIAVLYAIFGSDPLVGRFFVVWLFVMTVLFAYLIIRELGGSEKLGFWISLFINLYPSYCYFGSLLLKDTIVIPFILLGVLLVIKMVKQFSWYAFFLFFLITVAVSYLRFYVGYALLFSFIISWFLSASLEFRKKITQGFLFLFLIGFSPLLAGQGYFGYTSFLLFLNPEKITLYREISYNPDSELNANPAPKSGNVSPQLKPEQSAPSGSAIKKTVPPSKSPVATPSPIEIAQENTVPNGTGSSFLVETGFKQGPVKFIENSLKSFAYAVLGPFAWQLRYKRQLISLIETIPWYIFILISIYCAVGLIKKKGLSSFLAFLRTTAPLWSFSILALAALSLFINNYGIIARIRIPMFISLIIVMSFLIKKENVYAQHIINRSVEMIKRVFSFLPHS